VFHLTNLRNEDFHSKLLARKATADESKASIKFQSGIKPEPDTILAIDLNFAGNQIILQSHKFKEKCENIVKLDMTHAIDFFKFYVSVCDGKLRIALNDKHLYDYATQVSIPKIKAIIIVGDLARITRVDHRTIYPAPFPPLLKNEEDFCFNMCFPRRLRTDDKILIEIVAEEEFSLCLGSHEEDFLIVFGKLESSGTFEITSQNQTLMTTAKWNKEVPIVLKFLIKKDSIWLMFDKIFEDMAMKIEIEDKIIAKILRIKAKCDKEESMEVRKVLFNIYDENQ
jgi:hypothetical protein